MFGVLGILGLLGGLIGTCIPDGWGGLFGNDPDAQNQALGGIVTIVLSTATAGVAMFFISRHMQTLPLLGRLVLTDEGLSSGRPSEDAPEFAAIRPQADGPRRGDLAEVVAPLRPSGRIRVHGQLLDAQSERGYLDAGERVRLMQHELGSWLVEPDDHVTAQRLGLEKDTEGID